MEKDVKRLKALVILLVVALLWAGSYLTYLLYFKGNEKTLVKDDSSMQEYTYEQMAGVYTFRTEQPVTEDGKEHLSASLQLFDNGMFKYTQSVYAPMGQVGNYIIEGDKIRLNYIFETNSGTGFMNLSGTKILTITDKNSIYDENIKLGDVALSGNLTRNNESQDVFDLDEYLKVGLHDFSFFDR